MKEEILFYPNPAWMFQKVSNGCDMNYKRNTKHDVYEFLKKSHFDFYFLNLQMIKSII